MRWWIRSLGRRRWRDADIDKELRFHVDQQIAHHMAAGASREEAERRARLEFGGVQQIREDIREVSMLARIDALRADVRYAGRALRRSPGFAAAAMMALALGSGGTTALATILNDLILRPPRIFRDAQELVVAGETSPRDPSYIEDAAPEVYAQWKFARTLQQVAALRDSTLLVRVDNDVESTFGHEVSTNLLRLVGTAPIVGRDFSTDDARPEAAPVALISYGFWQRRFAGDPRILDRSVDIGGRSHAIVGVLPREYALAHGASILIPLSEARAREGAGLLVVGRLGAGTDIGEVRAELGALQQVAGRTMTGREPGWGVRVDPLRGRTGLGGRGMALAFPIFFAVALLTLVATAANLAILMVARGMARVKEAAVRAALGASRARLTQQVLLEALLLAAGGGALGLVIAVALSRLLISLAPGAVPPEFDVRLDLQVFGFAALIVILAGLLAGAAPALAAARTDVVEILKGVVVRGHRPSRLRGALVVVEMSIAMMLVVGVGILLTAYGGFVNLNPGFDRSGLLMVRLETVSNASSQADEESIRNLLKGVRALPGARATASSILPALRGGSTRSFSIEGRNATVAASATLADVDTDFFGTVGLKVTRGRAFDNNDPAASDQVVISETLGRRYWPSSDPLGQFVRLEGETRVRQIVAIVSDVRRNPAADIAIPYLYRLRSQADRETFVLIRSTDDVSRFAPMVRTMVREAFPGRPLVVPMTLEEIINRQANDFLFAAFIISPTILLTLVLSAAGIYGLIAQTVAARTHELGVRAALGASRRQLVGLILADGLKLARTGAIVGLAVVIGINRLAISAFVGVGWASPVVVASAVALMVVVALAASCHPALRAARVDPMTALRYE